LATHCLDLVDDLLRGAAVAAAAINTSAEIVYHNERAVASEAQRVISANAATRTSDNNNTTLT
jgi:hypothetical protein